MNYKEMIPVLEELRQSQSDWLAKVQAHAEAYKGDKDAPLLPTLLEAGCMPLPSNVIGMLQNLYGPDLKVLGLNGYTEKLLWKTKGWELELPENASDEDREAFRKQQIACTKTITLTSLIENIKNS